MQISRYLILQFLQNVAKHIPEDTVSHPTVQRTSLHYTDFLVLIIGLLVRPQDEEMDDVHLGYLAHTIGLQFLAKFTQAFKAFTNTGTRYTVYYKGTH
jgi:hypothetical protein